MHRHYVDEVLQEAEQQNERQRPQPQAAIVERPIQCHKGQPKFHQPEYQVPEPAFMERIYGSDQIIDHRSLTFGFSREQVAGSRNSADFIWQTFHC